MSTATKQYFACSECAKKTSTTDAKRVKARLCAACAPDLASLPAKPKKPGKASRPVVTSKPGKRVAAKPGRKAAKPKGGSPIAEAKPAAAEVAVLDQRIAAVREAMNRLASDLSAKRIELAALREQRRTLGPLPRSSRDPNAPKRVTLLDATAIVLAEADEPMKAKAIWQAIAERDLYSTSGKTPYATIAAAVMREVAEKGKKARFVKTGRGLFAANPA